MSFWSLPNGKKITGSPEAAFLQDFPTIPDNTSALAQIKSFMLIEKEANQYGDGQKYYEIVWKIISDDFKGRQVLQKIKVFDGKPEAIERNLNMFKLIMDLCQFKPVHSDAPTNTDLVPMVGKILGIKIREWSMPKQDGSGFMTGNNVSEVHAPTEFVCEVGTKLEVSGAPESASSRNPKGASADLEDDIPF